MHYYTLWCYLMTVAPSAVHPFVKWGQNETHVFISVQLSDSEDVQVTIGDETLNFSAVGNGSHGRVPYSFVLDYYLPVVSKQSRYTITGRAVIFRLRKEIKETWPRLNCQTERLPWTRLDFDLYQFDASDLEGSEPETGNVDLKMIRPSKEERELHNAEMKKLEYEEKWEAFLKILKHPSTIYLLLFNLLQFAGFLYVFGKLILTSLRPGESADPAEWYNEAVLRLIVAQLLAFLEPIHIVLGWVPGSALASALQVYGRSFVLFFIVIPHEQLHATVTVFWLFFAWSAIELVRYPYYMASLLGFRSGLLTYLRHTLWIPLYPTGFICEGKLILRALPSLVQSRRFSYPMPNAANMSFDFAVFLHIHLIGMLGGFYYLMRYMYARRKRVIGPRPRVGADQMGFFSYIPIIRSMLGANRPSAIVGPHGELRKRCQLESKSRLSKLA